MACTHLGIIFLSIAALAAGQDPKVTTDLSASELDIGGALEVKCTAENLQGGSSFLRIGKYFHNDEEPVVFATNSILQAEFKDKPRYSIAFNVEGDKYVFTFTITDIKVEDAGEYMCGIFGGDGLIVQDKKPLTVVNLDNFKLSMKVTQVSTGEEFSYETGTEETHDLLLDESQDFNIEFETTGTNPAPVVEVRVGSHTITDQFTLEEEEETFTGADGLSGIKFKATGSATIHVDHSFTAGMTVEASVNGNVEADETFEVKFTGFPPELQDCLDSMKAGDHEKDVEYSCSFLSSDPPEVYFYYLRDLVGGGHEKVDLFPGTEHNNYEVVLDEDSDEQQYTAVLKMPIVYPQMFTEYSLFIVNTRGNLTHKFKIERDADKELVNPNSSSNLVISIATIFAFVMTAALFQRL